LKMLDRPARGAADLHEVFGVHNGAPKNKTASG